jgi:hypothetical protein
MICGAPVAHDVFVSYSTKDKPIADAVCATLESAGVRCWIAPRDIQPGADWGEAIVNAIEGSRVLILIFSGHANESPQVKRELQHGFDSGVVVIPFRVENIMPNKSLDYYLGSVHWLDALSTPLEKHLQTLAAKTKGLLQTPPDGSNQTTAPPSEPPLGAPPPVLGPRKSSSAGIWVAVAAVLVVGFIAVFSVYRLTNRPVETTVAPSPAPAPIPPQPAPTTQPATVVPPAAPSADPIVDPIMVDSWRTKFPTPNGDVVLNWVIRADGTYSSNVTGPASIPSETGHVRFDKNNWQLHSDDGRTDQGLYTELNPHDMVISGTHGTSVWTRLAAELSAPATVDPVIVGNWQLTVPSAQGNSTWAISIDPDGRYTFTVTAAGNTQLEAGHVNFNQSTWDLRADGGRVDHGSYTVLNPNSVTVSGSGGTVTWTRVAAIRPAAG